MKFTRVAELSQHSTLSPSLEGDLVYWRDVKEYLDTLSGKLWQQYYRGCDSFERVDELVDFIEELATDVETSVEQSTSKQERQIEDDGDA